MREEIKNLNNKMTYGSKSNLKNYEEKDDLNQTNE